jgi:hypothetical protein
MFAAVNGITEKTNGQASEHAEYADEETVRMPDFRVRPEQQHGTMGVHSTRMS